MVRGALLWGAVAVVPIGGISFLARGRAGAISALIALGIVLVNAGLAALMSALAARVSRTAPMMISIPSFALRMLGVFLALALLKGASFIDQPAFALTFGFAVTAVLVLEARSWKRTPWIALTLTEEKP